MITLSANKINHLLGWIIIASLATAFIFGTNSSSALSGSEFKAGRIIDDAYFYNGNTMSSTEVQSFLSAKVPACDTWGTQPYGGTTRANYGTSRGYPPPYTCLKDYRQDTGYKVGQSGLCSAIDAKTNRSAAQIIDDIARACHISQKVILVMLQKEQGLVTDDWPWSLQYRGAMGYGCPDTAPCDAEYYGFFNQVYNAALQFQRYKADPTYWNHVPFMTNQILYQANAPSCGSRSTYIENYATAGLYNYTPYTPNAAALNNLYGTGDSCSAYGNRNFWRYYNDWFGSTLEYTPFFQLPGSSKTYMLGANSTYYLIDSYDILKHYGFESTFGYRVKSRTQDSLNGYTYRGILPLIARFEAAGVFLLQDSKTRPFPSEEIFTNYGYSFGQEAFLTKETGYALSQGDPVWRVASESDGMTTYYVSNGKKQAICNNDAFTTLGTPVYSGQSKASLSKQFLSTLPNAGPIAVDGDVIESWGVGSYGIWQNNQLVPIDSEIARGTKAITCGAPSDAVNQLPKSTVKVENLVSDSNGKQFVINGNQKLQVNAGGGVNIGTSVENHPVVTDNLLNKLSTGTLKNILKASDKPNVYTIRDAKRYGIPSESDLFGLGFSYSDIQSVTAKTLSVTPYQGLIFRPGKLIRESGTLGVYITDNNFQRYPFTSEGSFLNFGFKWSEVTIVSKDALTNYTPKASSGAYIREDDGNYWVMDGGLKRRIIGDLSSSAYYSLTPETTITLPGPYLSRFPMSSAMTKVFRAHNERGVYMIENGKKRVFASEEALLSRGFTWSDVRVISAVIVNSIPSGAPLY